MRVRITIEYDPDWSEGQLQEVSLQTNLDAERNAWVFGGVCIYDLGDALNPDGEWKIEPPNSVLFEVLDNEGKVLLSKS